MQSPGKAYPGEDLFWICSLEMGASRHATWTATPSHAWACFQTLFAIYIIDLALVGVRQHHKGFTDLLELLRGCLLIVRVLVLRS